jgi:hypothetical protein
MLRISLASTSQPPIHFTGELEPRLLLEDFVSVNRLAPSPDFQCRSRCDFVNHLLQPFLSRLFLRNLFTPAMPSLARTSSLLLLFSLGITFSAAEPIQLDFKKSFVNDPTFQKRAGGSEVAVLNQDAHRIMYT